MYWLSTPGGSLLAFPGFSSIRTSPEHSAMTQHRQTPSPYASRITIFSQSLAFTLRSPSAFMSSLSMCRTRFSPVPTWTSPFRRCSVIRTYWESYRSCRFNSQSQELLFVYDLVTKAKRRSDRGSSTCLFPADTSAPRA